MLPSATPRLLLLGAGVLAVARVATAEVATTSTTTSSTTTTIAESGCDQTLPGTLAAARCRLDALATEIAAQPALGAYQSKLSATLDRAGRLAAEADTACAAADTQTASRRMKQAKTFLGKMSHRLRSLSARHRLDGGVRAQLIQAIDGATDDLSGLRKNPCGTGS
jgi:hypothetical protein